VNDEMRSVTGSCRERLVQGMTEISSGVQSSFCVSVATNTFVCLISSTLQIYLSREPPVTKLITSLNLSLPLN